MRDVKPLCDRGIVTVACVRGNAAAGGVALAAACDVTIASRGVVLNPAYRAMGLHGSEFHSSATILLFLILSADEGQVFVRQALRTTTRRIDAA